MGYFNKFASAALHNYNNIIIYDHQIPADIANAAKQSIQEQIVIEIPTAPLIL